MKAMTEYRRFPKKRSRSINFFSTLNKLNVNPPIVRYIKITTKENPYKAENLLFAGGSASLKRVTTMLINPITTKTTLISQNK